MDNKCAFYPLAMQGRSKPHSLMILKVEQIYMEHSKIIILYEINMKITITFYEHQYFNKTDGEIYEGSEILKQFVNNLQSK